jgi:23S rRNA (adenine2030-N6)-methyltransferase
VRALMRPHDRAALCELHKDDAAHLRWRYARDKRVKVCELDGWTGLNAFIPPKERRGLVLIDPPFEEPGEFERMNDALASGIRKWATGIFLLWYPIKHINDTNAFAEQLSHNGISKIMRAELYIHEPVSSNRLNGNGLIIVNPPWLLEAELRVVLPALAALLQKSSRGGWKIDQITN